MALVKLSQISHTISKGTTPTTLGLDFTKSGIPFLRAEDVTNDAVNFRNVAFHISPKTHDLLSRSKLQAGDFLITIAGTLGRVGYVPAGAPSLNCNQAVAFARLDSSKVVLKYLFLICQSSDVMKNLLDGKKVGTIGNLNLEQVGNLLIPLPKPDEQKRISAILDKADQMRRQCRFANALSDSFLQSVFIKMFGDPMSNPMNWEQVLFGKDIKLKSGEFLNAQSMDSKGKYPVYGGNGISGYHSSFLFEERKIVIGRVGAYCGRIHYSNRFSWITDNALYVVRKSPKLMDVFLVYLLYYLDLNQYSGQSGQPLISEGRLESINLITPPLPLQERFAYIVQQFERIDRQQREATRQSEHLFQTLLRRAFRGEL